MRVDTLPREKRRARSPAPSAYELRVNCPNRGHAVRRALESATSALRAFGLTPSDLITVELVLAEALNNVAEHAYGDDIEGIVKLQMSRCEGVLSCVVIDGGAPMPGGRLPDGNLPAANAEDALEGGYGWFLIHTLSRSLRYERIDGQNRLEINIALNPPPMG